MASRKETRQLIFQKRYKVLEGYEVANRIIKIFEGQCSLSNYQKDWLRRELGDSGMYGNLDMPFQAYEWERDKYKPNVWQRIAVPFVILLNLMMMVTVCPIKWFLTGDYFFDSRTKGLQWFHKFTLWALGEK